MSQLDVTPLRYLVAIGEEGSLTRAAAKVGVTQPTLSAAMRHLEDQVGAPVLVRSHTGVRLTPLGEELVSGARKVLGELAALAERVTGHREGRAGSFVVGCHPSLAAYFLPDFLARWFRERPLVRIELWNGTSADVLRAVVDGDAVFGLVVNAAPHPDLVVTPAFHDAIAVHATQRVASVEEGIALLRGSTLVHIARPPFDALLGRLAAIDALSERRMVCGDLELVKSLAIAGVGPALLPQRVAEYGHSGLVELHPGLPRFDDTIHLVYRPENARTESARLLKEALLQRGRELDR